jgi:hypothetical protein
VCPIVFRQDPIPATDAQIVAREILRYLQRFPNAAETLEGIASWWVPRQRIYEAREVVERAVKLLVDQGRLRVTHVVGGVEMYRLSSKGEADER